MYVDRLFQQIYHIILLSFFMICLTGNRHLLSCDRVWRELIKMYGSKGCVVDGNDFPRPYPRPPRQREVDEDGFEVIYSRRWLKTGNILCEAYILTALRTCWFLIQLVHILVLIVWFAHYINCSAITFYLTCKMYIRYMLINESKVLVIKTICKNHQVVKGSTFLQQYGFLVQTIANN